MEMSRREQDELERAIALSLADTGRGEGAGVAANDVEAQIIQQVIEMSRREQDEFERAMALSLADTGRDGVEAGMGVAASASREADSESHIAATPRALRLPERESVHGAALESRDLRMSSRSSQYVKDVGGNDNIKKSPGGYFYKRESENDPWVRISEAEYKERRKEGGHLVDLGIAAKLLHKIPGPGFGEKRLAALKDVLNEGGTNLRSKTFAGNHLSDKVPESHFSEFLDGDLSETTLRERWTRAHSAKLAQYRRFLSNTEGDDRVPESFRTRLSAFVRRLEGIDLYGSPSTRTPARDSGLRLDGEPDRRTRIGRDLEAKLKDSKSTSTPSKESKSTSTPSKDSDRQQQQERERVEAVRQRQQKWELARQQQQERERVEAARQQQERALQQQQQQQQQQELERAQNPWNVFQRDHAGFGYTPSQMSTAYQLQLQQQQQPRELERAQNPWNVFQRDHAGLGYTPSQMSASYHHGDGFRGSACHAVSSNPTGPRKADGTPDMRYKANRR